MNDANEVREKWPTVYLMNGQTYRVSPEERDAIHDQMRDNGAVIEFRAYANKNTVSITVLKSAFVCILSRDEDDE